MEQLSPASTVDVGGRLKSDFLDGFADSLGVPEAKRRSFKEDVKKAATEFRAGRATLNVGAIRKEITSLAKAVAKVLDKPTQKKGEALRWRLDNLSPEAINYLLRHRPPHDRGTPPWGLGELTTESLEILYALCCAGTFWKDKNGARKLETKYGPVKEPGRPQDHAKMILVIRMGAAFHAAKGTYPERADIVLMADRILEQLGEPAKQDRDWQDTHMAREYLRLLKEPHDAVAPSRTTAKGKRRKKARDRLTRMREKLLPVLEAELVGKKCVRRGDEWHEALSIIYEPDTNAFYVIYDIPAVIGQWTEKKELPPSFTKAAIEKLYG